MEWARGFIQLSRAVLNATSVRCGAMGIITRVEVEEVGWLSCAALSQGLSLVEANDVIEMNYRQQRHLRLAMRCYISNLDAVGTR